MNYALATLVAAVLFVCLCTLRLADAAAQGANPTGCAVRVTTDRPESLAKVGDSVKFSVEVLKDGQPAAGLPLHYRLSWDNIETISEGELTSADTPVAVDAAASKIGFLRIDVTLKDADGKAVQTAAAVGVEPERIVSPVTTPDDFDAFWAAKKKLVLDDPMNPQMTPVDSGRPDCEIFDLQINCPGGAVCSGYFGRPRNAKPGTLPAVLFVHSAGVWSSWIQAARKSGEWDVLAYDMNAHGIPNGHDRPFYEALDKGELKDYPFRGMESRDTMYFLGMYMRIVRGIQFLTSQPEWDGRTLIVMGASQGGGQAIVAAGLDERVTLASAAIPAMANETGFLSGQPGGWPRLPLRGNMPTFPPGEYSKAAAEASRYMDAVNFARRAKADILMSVGFVDTTCPPTSVYAMFNALPTPKKTMLCYPNMGHGLNTEIMNKQVDEWVGKYIAEHRVKAQPASAAAP